MDFEDLKRNWDALGHDNPLWSILSSQDTWDLEEFYATGRTEIANALATLDELGIDPSGRALDFGCGAGRLTQALGALFDDVVGVDVAPAMIEIAEEHNRLGDRCTYVLNQAEDLSVFPDSQFDFVYSNIVLQHVGTKLAMGYITEFLRVAKPGSIVMFQVPSELVTAPVIAEVGFRADIEVIEPDLQGDEPMRAQVGTPLPTTISVRNSSPVPWGDAEEVRVGIQWFDESDGGHVLIDDGQRVRLPARLMPGETVDLPVRIDVPNAVGRYVLEIDLLQELVAWFKDHGSTPCTVPVSVAPGPGAADEGGADASANGHASPGTAEPPGPVIPRMEMHPVPRDVVEALVRVAGGEIVAVLDDDAAGDEWISYTYVARRLAAAT